jgi:hypothetical protein
MSVLVGTLAVALFNASKDPIARNFAYLYAVISVGILVRVLRTILLVRIRLKFFYHHLLSESFHPLIRASSYLTVLWVCPVSAPYHYDPQT